ncbi:MAG: hypothetical protein PVH88_21645 [Ignavibacteria bacterium]|jgi:hypothetical protein
MKSYKVRYITDTNITHGFLILSDDSIVFTTDGRGSGIIGQIAEGLLGEALNVNGPLYTFDGGAITMVFPYNEITRFGEAKGSFMSSFQKRLLIEHQGNEYYFALDLTSKGSPKEVVDILIQIYGEN